MYMAESRTKFEGKIWGKQLGQDFYLDLSTQRMGYVMVSDNTNRSQYMSFFYHLRNGLAHGRFGIVPLPREDYMIIVEDGEAKDNLFEVTARMVIKASSLLAIREIIITGPDEDIDYGREIIDSINKGNTNKRTVMADIMISENIWDREIQKLRLNGEVFFEGGKWHLVKC